MQQQIDGQRVREFAGQLMGLYTGSMLSFMVDIGYKTGLFEAAVKGPGTSQEIAHDVRGRDLAPARRCRGPQVLAAPPSR